MNKPKYVIFGNAESGHLLKWAQELVKYYNVFVVSPLGVHDKIKDIIPSENIFSLKMKINPDGGNAKMLSKIFVFRRIFKKIKPDIVNAHYITSHGFISALLKRVFGLPYFLVESAWGTDILVTPKKNRFYKWITTYSLNAANIVTSDSEFMSKVVSEYSGVHCLTFPFGLDKLPEVKLDEKDPNLYFSNRALTDNYNINKVIELFCDIVKSNKNARLVISNDGSLRSVLENQARELDLSDVITFKGFLNAKEQGEIYKKASYFISIPTSDSTSVSLLEAMGYGCIPILSDLPANREWVKHGFNGVIIEGNVISDIPELNKVFDYNRNLIAQKAIFSDNMKELVELIGDKNQKL